ncbi:Flp pilus assembly protein CpaB [Bacillus wiedmannii]|uniref:Flp pilus assembly protein CpaB n=1 Tax=Bacillus wiedmannii TaxID=1890302 RepID=UPI00065BEFB6|nr:Flp pilus assembly protein CpaB [Bacillus wiedmannii]KMP70562.1 pilus assembly protein CpaB [Bacillus cereus]MCQ6545223.1 Flp pilus assembly protein CpaB [Bacillus wiedmannii]MCQ6572753.1 Flp pilus assembly protein CpaB [Bacillus wiedmannii]
MKPSKFQKKQIIAVGLAAATVAGIYGYNHFAVENAVKPTKIVVAAKDIPAHTEIKEDMLVERTLPGDAIPPNALRVNKKDVVGKWTNDGQPITENSYLFKNKVVKKEELPDSAILNLKDGEVAFPLLVDLETSSGNSIIPNTYVDLYFKQVVKEGDNEKVVFGGLFQRIRVTAAKDSNTEDAFVLEKKELKEEQEGKQKPKVTRLYTLAVSPEQLQYLNRAKTLGDVIPVAVRQKIEEEIQPAEGFSQISDQKNILDYVEKHSTNPISKNVKEYVAQYLNESK